MIVRLLFSTLVVWLLSAFTSQIFAAVMVPVRLLLHHIQITVT